MTPILPTYACAHAHAHVRACTHTDTHKYTFSATYYWPDASCPENPNNLFLKITHWLDCYMYANKFPQSLLSTSSSNLLLQ